jgi:acetylornithine/N-succinyldiaminopimelate aminotransferase
MATLAIIEEEGLLDNAIAMGALIRDGVAEGMKGVAGIREIRGRGLMIGIELDRPCGDLVKLALEKQLLINVTVDNVVRLLPPLNLTTDEARQIVSILVPLIREFLARPQPQAATKS